MENLFAIFCEKITKHIKFFNKKKLYENKKKIYEFFINFFIKVIFFQIIVNL